MFKQQKKYSPLLISTRKTNMVSKCSRTVLLIKVRVTITVTYKIITPENFINFSDNFQS